MRVHWARARKEISRRISFYSRVAVVSGAVGLGALVDNSFFNRDTQEDYDSGVVPESTLFYMMRRNADYVLMIGGAAILVYSLKKVFSDRKLRRQLKKEDENRALDRVGNVA